MGHGRCAVWLPAAAGRRIRFSSHRFKEECDFGSAVGIGGNAGPLFYPADSAERRLNKKGIFVFSNIWL